VTLFRTIDDPFGLAWALHTLGLAYARLGQTSSHASPLWHEAMDHFAKVGDVSGITILLGDYVLLAVAEGDLLRAVRLMAASEQLASVGGTGLGSLFHRLERTYPEVASLDPAAVQAAIDVGRRMSVPEAVDYALSGSPSPVLSASKAARA
jgi:hypothetical protein